MTAPISSSPSAFALLNHHLREAGLGELPKNGKVALTSEGAEKLNAQLGKLTQTDREAALKAFDQYKDRFEWNDPRPLKDVIGASTKAADLPKASAPRRSVATAQADAVTPKKPVSKKEMKKTMDAIDSADAPKELKDQVKAGVMDGANKGAFKADTEARPAMVKGIMAADQDGSITEATAKIGRRRMSTLSELMSRARCFEELIGLFMFEVAKNMQEEVKDKMETIKLSDPNMPKIDRLKALVKAVQALPPETQKNIAGSLQQKMAAEGGLKLKEDPDMAPLKDWLGALGPSKPSTYAEGAPKADPEMPAISDPIAKAMIKSDDPELMQMGRLAESMGLAGDLQGFVKAGPDAFKKLDNETLDGVRDKMDRLEAHLGAFQDVLPTDVKMELNKRPADDMISRQTQFEELKMLMNDFSQVMQALSGILSTLDNVAMTSVRKIEAR